MIVALSRCELVLASAQLLRSRGEADLRVDERLVGAGGKSRHPSAARFRNRVCELPLFLLDGGDSLGQLLAQAAELLLGRDADRSQPIELGIDRDRLLCYLATTEKGHVSMICGSRPFSCRRRLRGALEALFGAGAADDVLALAEAEPRLLHAECLPELLEAGVELGDLFFHGRVEPTRRGCARGPGAPPRCARSRS